MKWILAILLLLSVGAIGQTDDSTKYIHYKFQYGSRMPRFWADSVLRAAGLVKFTGIAATTDTTANKPVVVDASGNVLKMTSWPVSPTDSNTNIANSDLTSDADHTLDGNNYNIYLDNFGHIELKAKKADNSVRSYLLLDSLNEFLDDYTTLFVREKEDESGSAFGYVALDTNKIHLKLYSDYYGSTLDETFNLNNGAPTYLIELDSSGNGSVRGKIGINQDGTVFHQSLHSGRQAELTVNSSANDFTYRTKIYNTGADDERQTEYIQSDTSFSFDINTNDNSRKLDFRLLKLPLSSSEDDSILVRDSDGIVKVKAAGGGTQNLQQVFDQGSVLTKPDTIYQQNNLLLATGQLANGDTIHFDENQKLLVYGVSIDRGDTSGAGNLYSTDWVKQLAASMGLYTDNRSVSGSKLIKVSNGDNSLEDLLPSIPVYNSTVKLLAIGNYPVNEVDFNDSTLYRSTLSAILDTLIIARGYPATKIFLLNGTPARLKDTARLRRLSVATMNVAIEKGCLYWDSYSYMLPCLSCNRSGGDDVHLTPHGYFYLTDGILNASVIDSLNYIRANNMHVENAFTSHGDLYANGITNYGKDSTFGNQYIGGTLNLVGNVLNATTFNNGITVTGDAVPNAQKWVLFRNGNIRYGMGLSGTDYRIFTSGAATLKLGSVNASDGTTFTQTFTSTTSSNTSHVPFIASSSASVGTALTVTGGASVGGDASFREINLYNNGALKFGAKMQGSSPYYHDLYCGDNLNGNAVRLGWITSANAYTPVLSAHKNGTVLIGNIAAQPRKLYVDGSIGANKDSVTIITTIGSRYLLAQDTAAGSSLGQFMRILPSNLGFSLADFSNVTGTLGVANGGTGNTSLTAYALLAGGTTGTGALQQVSGTGTSGQVLTSAGAGALPTWQTLSLNGSTTHDFGTIANNSSATTTVSVTGAADGDYVLVTKPIANGWSNGESYTAWVSAADQVTVRQNNNSGGSAGFGSQTINVKVIKQ